MTAKQDAIRLLSRKLDSLAALDDADHRALAALPLEVQAVPNGRYLVTEGDETVRCCLLLQGYVCRHKRASDGSRQIVSFHLAGDLLDLQHLMLARADHNVQAITDAKVAWIPSAALKALAGERPKIGEALWRDTLIDASIFREWVLNVGQRDAKARIAHMLCEFAVRRQAAGLGDPERFDLPMTQEQIADATGLTPVHVNRTLKVLGDDGLIDRRKRSVAIADWDRMRRVADFDPHYLHLAISAGAWNRGAVGRLPV